MSHHLATIITNAPLDFDPGQNLRRPVKPELYNVFLRLEFNKLIDKMRLTPPETPPAEKTEQADVTVHVEQAASGEQAEKLLATFRQAEYVTLLALPDLTAVAVQCETGPDSALVGTFYFHRYQGDWNRLLAALFAGDIKIVSHDVKDLTRTLLENGLPADSMATSWTPRQAIMTSPACSLPGSKRSCLSPSIWNRTPFLPSAAPSRWKHLSSATWPLWMPCMKPCCPS